MVYENQFLGYILVEKKIYDFLDLFCIRFQFSMTFGFYSVFRMDILNGSHQKTNPSQTKITSMV